ncbi:MAG TPA: amidase [Candidatus Angelobacter sp.]|nr:amidase [Candidatus Angelobacter sp.]
MDAPRTIRDANADPSHAVMSTNPHEAPVPLTHRSATELARLIRDRNVSAREVMEEHLAAIERRNPTLNAIVAIADDALDSADARDRALARGEPIGPLHGVPFTAKDIIEAAGLPTTLGMIELADSRPDHDATVVGRMRAAGAILLGKTNCPPGGSGGVTENDLHGRTLNPYDERRSPGGSSGGEAAAIAAGLSPCGIGSDSGGSLRVPAHFCGIATLKPTAGRIPITGVLDDRGQLGSMRDPRTQAGPMARRADDLGTLLSILAGPDGSDAGCVPAPLGDPSAVDLHGVRVMLYRSDGVAPPDAETDGALVMAAAVLRERGAIVAEGAPPPGGHDLTERVWDSYGDEMTAPQVYDVLQDWDAFRTTMLAVLERFDLILSPVAPEPAPRHGGDVVWRYTTPHSLTGWPCVVVRAGTSAGMPVGVQLVSGPWQEDVAIAAAVAIERTLGGWQPPGEPAVSVDR